MCVSADEAEGGGDVGGSDIEKVASWAVFPMYMNMTVRKPTKKTVHDQTSR
jgi:hypothetical protein